MELHRKEPEIKIKIKERMDTWHLRPKKRTAWEILLRFSKALISVVIDLSISGGKLVLSLGKSLAEANLKYNPYNEIPKKKSRRVRE